jgi:hypothetical protein
MSTELPPDWRERMIDMIRGAAPLEGSWFSGGPACSPLEQIDIYRRQYRLRLYDALLVEVPGLHKMLGDTSETESLLRRYLDAHPSQSFSLNRIADALAPWLSEQPDVPVEVVEMARLDAAVARGFEAADGVPLDPSMLVDMPALKLQPHVTLLRLSTNVHELRSALLTNQPRPELVRGDFPLAVYRRGIAMRHWSMALPLWGILEGLSRGQTVAEAVNEVFTRNWVDAGTLSNEIGTWFRDMAERNLVEVITRAT